MKISDMQIEQTEGWIGVELEGVLALRTSDGSIGEPILPACSAVKALIAAGKDVRIVDALARVARRHAEIIEWCERNLGAKLGVELGLRASMTEFWSARAVQMVPDKGVPTVRDALTALMYAEKIYFFAMQHGGFLPPSALEELRLRLGIPASVKREESLIRRVGSLIGL
jgi:hypothetical protein